MCIQLFYIHSIQQILALLLAKNYLTQSTYTCRIDWNHSMFNTSLFRNSSETEEKLRKLSHKRNDLIAVCSIVGKLADCDELMHPVETEIGRKYLKKLIIFKL